MEYEKQVLTIQDNDAGTRDATAFIGVGTGLAITCQEHDMWMVTHVQSGLALPNITKTQGEAKRYLEGIVVIFKDHWNCDLATFKKRFKRHGTYINKKAKIAYEAALSRPGDDFFLYACNDIEPFPESVDAANIDPNSEENQRIATGLLKDYPEATKVIMTRMDDGGKHHDLKVFLRTTMPQQA
jgi:hypothetical protein